jgi:hypothetical protein
MLKKLKTNFVGMLIAASAVTLSACGGGGGDASGTTAPTTALPGAALNSGIPGAPPGTSGPGALRVALTDAPACGFDQVNVTVDRVRVHQSSTAADTDGGWVDVPVVGGPRKVDLLSLTNGVLMELGETTLTAGYYSQIRLVLASNDSVPMSNTVKPTGGVETEMKTPSAQQSGLKLINGFTVAPGAVTDIVLDFDACKSIVRRGNGSFGLKPVIRVTPRALGEIVGYVETGVAGVTVSAQKDGVVIRATAPDPATGKFTLSLLDPVQGPYDVVFTAKDRTTAVVASVPAGPLPTPTILNSSIPPSPVTMPMSGSGSVSGMLLPLAAATTDGAQVRALQLVGTVPLVEVAFTTTFSAIGAYSLSLPVAAPRLATWSNPMVNPIPFLPQIPNAANYKLEASAPGYLTSARTDAVAPSAGINISLVIAP